MLADQYLRSRQRNSIIRTNTARQYVPHAGHWGRSNCSTAGQRTMSSRILPPCREADGIYCSVGSGSWSRSSTSPRSRLSNVWPQTGASRTARQPIGGDQRAAGPNQRATGSVRREPGLSRRLAPTADWTRLARSEEERGLLLVGPMWPD